MVTVVRGDGWVDALSRSGRGGRAQARTVGGEAEGVGAGGAGRGGGVKKYRTLKASDSSPNL